MDFINNWDATNDGFYQLYLMINRDFTFNDELHLCFALSAHHFSARLFCAHQSIECCAINDGCDHDGGEGGCG